MVVKISTLVFGSLLVSVSLVLAGCATPGTYYGPASSGYASGYNQGYYQGSPPAPRYSSSAQHRVGWVVGSNIYQVNANPSSTNGLGAVLGAVVGGVVGNQFGHGRGRVLTTVGGAVAGGFAGNAIQDHNRNSGPLVQEVTVRFNDNTSVTVRQPYREQFTPNEQVLVSGYGSDTRVTQY